MHLLAHLVSNVSMHTRKLWESKQINFCETLWLVVDTCVHNCDSFRIVFIIVQSVTARRVTDTIVGATVSGAFTIYGHLSMSLLLTLILLHIFG